MAKFVIKACKCKFEQGNGYRTMSFALFSDDLFKYEIDANNARELEAALDDAVTRAGQVTEGSYFVAEFLKRGERAFSGYRKKRWTREVDRDLVLKVLA